MKKLLFIFLLFTMFLGCATTTTTTETPVDPYPKLKADTVMSVCQPTETWSIRVMPMPMAVLRFDNTCGGIADLLTFVAPAEGFSEEQRHLSVALAVIYYVDYLNREKAVENKKWHAKAIKQENASEQGSALYYYEVTLI
jgi:uncharacterized protein YceK